jgi:hypothetical protein
MCVGSRAAVGEEEHSNAAGRGGVGAWKPERGCGCVRMWVGLMSCWVEGSVCFVDSTQPCGCVCPLCWHSECGVEASGKQQQQQQQQHQQQRRRVAPILLAEKGVHDRPRNIATTHQHSPWTGSGSRALKRARRRGRRKRRRGGGEGAAAAAAAGLDMGRLDTPQHPSVCSSSLNCDRACSKILVTSVLSARLLCLPAGLVAISIAIGAFLLR